MNADSAQSDMEGWPVLPEGVEGALLHSMPVDYEPPAEDCFVCGEPMPDAGSGEMCWGVPGRGVAHDRCYEPEEGDDEDR